MKNKDHPLKQLRKRFKETRYSASNIQVRVCVSYWHFTSVQIIAHVVGVMN